MQSDVLDDILNKISLSFGNESLELIIPHEQMIEMSMYRVGALDIDDLDGELVFLPKMYTLFTALLSFVVEKSNHAHTHVKRIEATQSLQYEKQLVGAGERATDKKIEKLVISDEMYKVAVDQDLDFKNMVMSFQNILKALEVKRDSLLQLVKKRRQEMEA